MHFISYVTKNLKFSEVVQGSTMSLKTRILSVFFSLHPQHVGKTSLMVTKWLPQFQASHPSSQGRFPNRKKGVVVKSQQTNKQANFLVTWLSALSEENLSQKLPSRLALTSHWLEQDHMPIPRPITGTKAGWLWLISANHRAEHIISQIKSESRWHGIRAVGIGGEAVTVQPGLGFSVLCCVMQRYLESPNGPRPSCSLPW